MEIVEDLPLTETTFLILLSISIEPKHGYAIMKDAEVLSDGRVRLSTGTLYGALKRLLEAGWIKRVPEREMDEEQESDRPIKQYKLTKLGGRVLQAEVRRMRKLSELARRHAQGAEA
jgi:DNA-binding PadR family transcriptional regulator